MKFSGAFTKLRKVTINFVPSVCLSLRPFVHLPKVITSIRHFRFAACVIRHSELFLIYMNFILLFIQFLVALVSVVAKLSVAPHPHFDFGYLGFSFFFLHIFFLPFDISILFLVCVEPDACIYNLMYLVFYCVPEGVSLQ